jgi:hypothetical protein
MCSFAGLAAGLAVLITQPLAGTAATLPNVGLPTVSTPAAHLPAVTTPQVTVPSVTVPSVTTPRVTTPVGSTPTVSTPSVTTPTATTPKVSTPVVKTPSVTTPSSTPSVPSPSVPAPSVPAPSGITRLLKTPNLPSSNSSSSSSSSSSPSGAPAATSGSSTDSPGTGPSSSPAGQRDAGTTAAAASGRARQSGSFPASSVAERRADRAEAASRHSHGAQQRAENRRLRTLVDRYRGCIGSLDSRSQRLLSLRAGLHGPPRSAGAVARILHISAGREQLLERMSLLALQTTGRGGCGGSSAVATVPISEPAQLTSAASWVASAGATPVSTASGSPSTSSPSSPQQQVRAAGGRPAPPVVITPAGTRTVEQASAGQDAVAWPEIVLLMILVLVVSLVALPGVRRRILPALAALPTVEGHADRTGVANVVAASALADASGRPPEALPAPEAPPAAEALPAPEALPAAGTPESLESAGPAAGPPPSASSPAGEPQAQPEGPTANPEPAVQIQTRPAWAREHATQGALVATVLAGGLVRILRRWRGR